MGGIILYLITFVIETISIGVRGVIVTGLVGMVVDWPIALVVGGVAAFGPAFGSLLVLSGVPSGHVTVRSSLGARPLTEAEGKTLERALERAKAARLPVPTIIFTIEDDGLNAAISGRTMYIYRDLYKSPYLPAVVAHELGHFNSLDGRLLLALRAFTVPGGFLLAYLLLGTLRWVAYGLASILAALLIVLAALLRIRIHTLVIVLFRMTIQLLRFTIIIALGGVGPALLGSIWRSYFVEREFAADAYARRLGYGDALIAFFEHEVLSDVTIPWYTQPTHPPTSQRIRALRSNSTLAPPSAPLPTWLPALVALLLAGLIFGAGLLLPHNTRSIDHFIPTPGPTPTLGL